MSAADTHAAPAPTMDEMIAAWERLARAASPDLRLIVTLVPGQRDSAIVHGSCSQADAAFFAVCTPANVLGLLSVLRTARAASTPIQTETR